jgi:hypothetical protein
MFKPLLVHLCLCTFVRTLKLNCKKNYFLINMINLRKTKSQANQSSFQLLSRDRSNFQIKIKIRLFLMHVCCNMLVKFSKDNWTRKSQIPNWLRWVVWFEHVPQIINYHVGIVISLIKKSKLKYIFDKN